VGTGNGGTASDVCAAADPVGAADQFGPAPAATEVPAAPGVSSQGVLARPMPDTRDPERGSPITRTHSVTAKLSARLRDDARAGLAVRSRPPA
jgi:hypothetical protein